MRFKCIPEDFRVDEVLTTPLARTGPVAVYRVEKRGVTTLHVRERLAAALGVPPSSVHGPALKDKQADAVQHLSVARGGRRVAPQLGGRGFEARLAGFLDRPLRPADLGGNRFTIVIRDLGPKDPSPLRGAFEALAAAGLPNYFDSQRFGSFAPGLGFPGRLLVLRQWEGALRAWLAEPQLGDEPAVLRLKETARAHWGEFATIAAAAPRSHQRSILTYLRDHPTGFRQAVIRIQPRLLGLWLSAWQSWLWNQIVGRFLGARLAGTGVSTFLLSLPIRDVPVPIGVPPLLRDELAALDLPLPSSRSVIGLPALATAAEDVLRDEGVAWPDLKARSIERAWLSRGRRALWIFPVAPAWIGTAGDDRHPGRRTATVAFSLPPGSYATLVLRALEAMAGAGSSGNPAAPA